MHTTSWTAQEENVYGDDDAVKKGDVFNFHFNSDLSGEVIINQQRYERTPTIFNINQLVVPAWMLIEFVGQYINREFISNLESMDGKETLEFLVGK